MIQILYAVEFWDLRLVRQWGFDILVFRWSVLERFQVAAIGSYLVALA